ncbi:MAG: MaoC family dehydratase [Chloroflexi bacterium]|nr:MaoC family dehydratase [Chloroflexota bacterium]
MSAPPVAPVVKTISQKQIARYADASGDHNPIHTDEAFARATAFEGTIAHGMLVLASISEMMAAAFGEAWLTRGRLRVRFRAPARPDDTITATAEARSSPDASPKENMLRYAVECRNQRDELLISGTAEVPELG